MRLLITGAWKYTKEQMESILQMGHEIYQMPDERAELPCAYECVEGVICNGLFLYHSIEKFTSLRFIQLTSAGLDRVPLEYIHIHKIKLYNAGGVYSVPMAEFALSSVLQIYKRSTFFYENQKQHRWKKNRMLLELAGKHVCIVGCGSVGTECAKRFQAFGCNVIGVDQNEIRSPHFTSIYPPESLKAVLCAADIIVLSVALTEKTRHLINKNTLSLMKENSILVNISRGAVVDENALIEELQNRTIYAVLDVFEEEPLSNESPLWNLENVIITPHNSFVGDGNVERLGNLVLKNLELNV